MEPLNLRNYLLLADIQVVALRIKEKALHRVNAALQI
jgi:hypothetical protein